MDNCVSPPELSDDQLLRFIDGEQSADVVEHLDRCPHCREKNHMLVQLQNQLTAHLYRFSCPTSIELGDYVLRLLPGDQTRMIADHLADCPHCQKEVLQLKGYLKELKPTSKPGPVEEARVLIARLVGGLAPGEVLDGTYAGLKLQPAYASLRGGTQGVITLQADGILIILQVEPLAEGRMILIGQVASDEQEQWTEAKVELYGNGVLLATGRVDNMGAFRCEGILPGAIELKIIPGHGPNVIANVEIMT